MIDSTNHEKKWFSPVGDPDSLDIIGKHKDEGVDVVLVVARPINLSNDDVNAVTQKFRNYCQYVKSAEFANEFGEPKSIGVRIIVRSDWEVPRQIISLIDQIVGEEKPPAAVGIYYEDPV